MEKSQEALGILGRRHWVFDLDGTLTVGIHDFPRIRALLGVPEGGDIIGHLKDAQASDSPRRTRKPLRFVADPGPAAGLQQPEANRKIAGLE